MAKKNPIQDAYDRSRIISAIVAQAQERARAQPHDKRWVECGLVSAGDTVEEAKFAIEKGFDSITRFITYAAILDIAGSFENYSQKKLSNHIGEIRKRTKQKSKNTNLPDFSERLVRNSDNFESLHSLWSLIDGYVGNDMKENFESIRDARNSMAHGSIGTAPPKIDAEGASKVLLELIDLF